MTAASAPKFDHLSRMTDRRGTFEHANLAAPRPEHGYCTDDMARVLVVATREPEPVQEVKRLARVAVQFLNDAQSYAGSCRNRLDRAGNWLDQPVIEDAWGRCLWALGTAAAHSEVGLVRQLAVIQFERAAKVRSTSPRATAFAAIGAAELLAVDPAQQSARKLVTDYADTVSEPTGDSAWPWPEPRLSYANAALPEAMIAAGVALDRPQLREQGLDLLAWLLNHETVDGHLSPTPMQGSAPGDPRPAFDQSPSEVSALADACARAATVDSRPIWVDGVNAAVAWFQGANDAGQPMWDPETGGGYDFLHADGVAPDQGAAATLAVLSTLQHARRFSTVPH
jgi:hypothetical protein